MISPAIPEDESERLSALYKLKILDSPAEERFERIIDITADFFSMPICYIAIIDHDRQWLKASCGLNFMESNRSVSFCGHTINYDDILIVPDTKLDERFHDNPLVIKEPFIRFYAGIPLRTIDGKKIGTLCIADKAPAGLDDKQVRQFMNLATFAEDQINLYDSIYLKNEIIEQKRHIESQSLKIEQSITCARNIQISTLQSETELSDLIPNSFVFQKAKSVLSGDFFLAIQVGHLKYIAAADCTGHGVPGAMVSITCYNALEKAIQEDGSEDVGKILDRTNEMVIDRFTSKHNNLKDGMDIFMICLNTQDNTIHYVGANNPGYFFRKSKETGAPELTVLEANRQPIGRFTKKRDFSTQKIDIENGDAIYMCSDGFQDQFGGPDNRKYGRKNLRDLFTQMQTQPQKERLTILTNNFDKWKGEYKQIDDILVIGLFF